MVHAADHRFKKSSRINHQGGDRPNPEGDHPRMVRIEIGHGHNLVNRFLRVRFGDEHVSDEGIGARRMNRSEFGSKFEVFMDEKHAKNQEKK